MEKGLNHLFSLYKNWCPDATWEVVEAKGQNDFLSVVTNSLNRHHQGGKDWTPFERKRLQTVTQRSPLAVLIKPYGSKKGTSLHWITIIDMYHQRGICYMIYNDDGSQYRATCHAVRRWAYEARLLGAVAPYTVVRLK